MVMTSIRLSVGISEKVVPWCTPYLDNTRWDVSRELLMA